LIAGIWAQLETRTPPLDFASPSFSSWGKHNNLMFQLLFICETEEKLSLLPLK
jgi:hypothetical protein